MMPVIYILFLSTNERGKEMALIVISVDRDKLPTHTDAEFEEWVRFEVGDNGDISTENPLWKEDLEARVR
jgi:hypothetical protein